MHHLGVWDCAASSPFVSVLTYLMHVVLLMHFNMPLVRLGGCLAGQPPSTGPISKVQKRRPMLAGLRTYSPGGESPLARRRFHLKSACITIIRCSAHRQSFN